MNKEKEVRNEVVVKEKERKKEKDVEEDEGEWNEIVLCKRAIIYL